MSFRVVDASAFEGRGKLVGRELAPEVLRLNRFDSQPGQEGFEHDERESPGGDLRRAPWLRGARVDGEEVPLEPGRYVLVTPESTRKVVAGADGLAYLVVGATLP